MKIRTITIQQTPDGKAVITGEGIQPYPVTTPAQLVFAIMCLLAGM